MNTKTPIQQVSDTAFWVAAYRAQENENPQALFRDPFAIKFTDEKTRKIIEHMNSGVNYTRHNVVMRTVVIDRFIERLVKSGVDTVVNLGAGLDARPYRMNLPADLHWIEIDYPHVIEFKQKTLANEKPNVKLEQISLDLADRKKRQETFQKINAAAKNVLVLTEGVLPYLTEEQVSTLSEDLHSQDRFHHWIADYLSPDVYRYLQTKKRKQQMRNAPMQFFPANWFGFFESRGWKPETIHYLNEEALKLGRQPPKPWWVNLLLPLLPAKAKDQFLKSSAYMVLEKV